MRNMCMVFWGELLPETRTGISVSNTQVLEILKKQGKQIVIVREKSWEMGKAGKVVHYLKICFSLIINFIRYKCKYFYFNIPLSRQGLLKLILILPVLKILRYRTFFTGHLHRGDLRYFFNCSGINKLILNVIFKFINKIIVLSPVFMEDLKQAGYDGEIVVLRNTSSFESENLNAGNGYKNRFVYISNYIETKGIFELVRCFSSEAFRKLKLDTFGNVYDPDLFHRVQQSCTSNITVHGPLNREDFAKTLGHYDALILPSWNEGQPIIIIEAMSLGVPVIATDVGDIKNMLGDDYLYLFKPKDMESMKQAILRFSETRGKSQLSQNLVNRYFEMFSNKIYEEAVKTIFS